MNDNILILEQTEHNIDYNKGDMFDAYAEECKYINEHNIYGINVTVDVYVPDSVLESRGVPKQNWGNFQRVFTRENYCTTNYTNPFDGGYFYYWSSGMHPIKTNEEIEEHNNMVDFYPVYWDFEPTFDYAACGGHYTLKVEYVPENSGNIDLYAYFFSAKFDESDESPKYFYILSTDKYLDATTSDFFERIENDGFGDVDIYGLDVIPTSLDEFIYEYDSNSWYDELSNLQDKQYLPDKTLHLLIPKQVPSETPDSLAMAFDGVHNKNINAADSLYDAINKEHE